MHLETVAEEGVDVGHFDAIHNGEEVPIGHDEVDDVSMQFAERELSKQIFIETDLAEKQLAEIYDDDIAKAKFPKKPGKECFHKRGMANPFLQAVRTFEQNLAFSQELTRTRQVYNLFKKLWNWKWDF